METSPFLKGLPRLGLIPFVFPAKHVGSKVQPNSLAVSLHHLLWVIQKIIGIDDTDVLLLKTVVRSIDSLDSIGSVASRAWRSACEMWANDARRDQIIKDTPNFVVSSFGRIEVVESSDFVKGGNRATIVRWDAIVRIPNQESKMELRQ